MEGELLEELESTNTVSSVIRDETGSKRMPMRRNGFSWDRCSEIFFFGKLVCQYSQPVVPVQVDTLRTRSCTSRAEMSCGNALIGGAASILALHDLRADFLIL